MRSNHICNYKNIVPSFIVKIHKTHKTHKTQIDIILTFSLHYKNVIKSVFTQFIISQHKYVDKFNKRIYNTFIEGE